MRHTLALLLFAACKKDPAPPPPAPVVVAIDAAPAAAPTDAHDVVCLPSGITAEITDGPRVKYCARERPPSTTKHCIAIDSQGAPSRLPDEPVVETNEDFELIAPAGWTAKKIEDDEAHIVGVELCKAGTCTKVPLALKKDMDLDDMLASVAIAPGGKTVAVDRGMSTMSRSRVELHTLAPPRFVRELSIPHDDCTNVAGFAGDYYFLQGIADCVNLGGSRALASADGKIKKVWSGMAATSAVFKNVGGTKWLIGLQDGVEVWDVATMKRVAKNPDLYGDFGVTDDHVLLTVDRDGKVTRYDAGLQVLGTSQVATCGS